MTTILPSKSPLVDAIVELRFEAGLPSQVIAGLLYSQLNTKYGYKDFTELPVMQLPTQVREQEDGLRFAAHYKMKSDNFTVSISQRVIVIGAICSNGQYSGWENYKAEVVKVVAELLQLESITTFSRVGVRYVNLIEREDTLGAVNLSINAPENNKFTDEQTLGFIYKNENIYTRVNYASRATINDELGTQRSGAVLDIDSFTEEPITADDYIDIVENGHENTERAFLNITTEEYKQELS